MPVTCRLITGARKKSPRSLRSRGSGLAVGAELRRLTRCEDPGRWVAVLGLLRSPGVVGGFLPARRSGQALRLCLIGRAPGGFPGRRQHRPAASQDAGSTGSAVSQDAGSSGSAASQDAGSTKPLPLLDPCWILVGSLLDRCWIVVGSPVGSLLDPLLDPRCFFSHSRCFLSRFSLPVVSGLVHDYRTGLLWGSSYETPGNGDYE